VRYQRATLTVALLLSAACASAQPIPKSQLATVTQHVAGARIEIVYRRPVARGRALFGALVPWGRIWSPSADTVARLSVSAPIEVNGARLAAGSYGLWAIPDSTSWTIIFSTDPSAFHLRYPERRDALRVRTPPRQGEHVETLEFDFPMVDADSAQLRLRWGTTIVPLAIRVPAASAQ
jgi:hypothetical protein